VPPILGTGKREGLREVVGLGRLLMRVSRGQKMAQKGNSYRGLDLAGWIAVGLHLGECTVELQCVGWQHQLVGIHRCLGVPMARWEIHVTYIAKYIFEIKMHTTSKKIVLIVGEG